jgi:hypothetical protein
MIRKISQWLLDLIRDIVFIFLLIASAAFCAVSVIYLPFYLYKNSTAVTFELKEKDWVCTLETSKSTTVYNRVGNITVPFFRRYKECQQYQRRGKE